jgi:alkylhydroperoxidase family enzyme
MHPRHFPAFCFCLYLSGFLFAFAPASLSAESAVTKADIQAREAYILGSPPRIPPLDTDSMDEKDAEAAWSVVRDIWATFSIPPQTDMSEYFATMVRHPKLMQQQVGLSMQLAQGALAPRDRELAVLRTAWLCQAPYEWGEHVQIGKRVAGFTSEEIERITTGSAAPEWDEHERAILRAVEELFADAMISDETWRILASLLDDRQLLELPVLVGYYQSVAYLQNAVRFRLRAGNPGLSLR